MREALKIMLTTSGLQEKYQCSLQDLINAYDSRNKGMWSEETRRRLCVGDRAEDMQSFIELMHQFSDPLSEIQEMFDRDAKENAEYWLEIEVKRSAGTLDAYLEENRVSDSDMAAIDNFFQQVRKKISPVSSGNSLN